MKSFLVKIVKFSMVVYGLLWLLQFVIDNGLKRSNDEMYYDWNKIYRGEINAELVFFGSSRTVKHYDPKIFDQQLEMQSYNMGANGTAYDLQRLKVNSYLKYNKKPKIIIQNVDITALLSTENLFQKEQYFPYYSFGNYKFLSQTDNSVTLEYLLPMFKYRGFYDLLDNSLKGYLGEDKNIKRKLYKGFHGSNQNWNFEFEKQVAEDDGSLFNFSHINFEERFEVFNKLLDDLEKSKALIFIIWSPEYYERLIMEKQTLTIVKSRYAKIAKERENIIFIDFTNDSICYNKAYFYNSYHLNKKGAELYSYKVLDSIAKYYKN